MAEVPPLVPAGAVITSNLAAAATAAATAPSRSGTSDDESEWEYEYSTTETETYYLTLDLSHPDFIQRNDEDVVANTRGGYKPWVHAQTATSQAVHPGPPEDEDGDEGDAPEANADEGLDDDDQAPLNGGDNSTETRRGHGKTQAEQSKAQAQDGRTKSKKTKQAATAKTEADKEEEEEREIQILDLHSSNPIISYRGMTFSGAWAENIGTEMLFMARNPRPSGSFLSDPPAPLPALRNLPQGIDLLAASSARISCRETDLKPRDDTSARQHDQYRAVRRRHGIHIPIQTDFRGSRRPQARFLENLMALKKVRGEKDEATVYPDPPEFQEFGDEYDKEEGTVRWKRAHDAEVSQEKRRRRRRRLDNGVLAASGAVSKGEQHGIGLARGKGSRGGGWSRGRGFKKPWAVLMMQNSQPMELATEPGPTLSTPTPTQWQDLRIRAQGSTTDIDRPTAAGANVEEHRGVSNEEDGNEDEDEDMSDGEEA